MVKMSYEKLVEECKRLRLKGERAVAEFFAFLMIAEREHAEIWQGGGCETFEQFLNSNHLCDSSRYRFFAIGVDRVGLEVALENGAHWTIQAGRMIEPTKKALEDFGARARAFVETEKTAPSEKAVREWAAQINANGREPQKIKQVSELHRLRAVVQEQQGATRIVEKQKTELERLREENQRLRAENLDLKAKLKAAEKRGPAREQRTSV